MALCGDASTANKVARRVLRRASAMFKTWETDDDAARWFARFTVLNARGYIASNPKRDALLVVTNDPQIIAAVYAVRQLPMQQREAFLLHHGQGMELRQMATTMDCSSAAAATHLSAAGKALRVLVPTGLTEFTSSLPSMLEQLVPPPGELEIQIQKVIHKRRLSAIVRFAVLWPAGLILVAAIAWEGYRIWKMIQT